MPVVELRGLVRRYGAVTAVDGIDLTVARGEVLAILGPNGAGKTTTVECCVGLRRPNAGTVRVLGLDPDRDARALRPRVGVMLQDGGLYPHVRVGEALATFAAFHRDPEDPTELLAALGLTALRTTRYRVLSGGERQRLLLALALVGRPEVLFLDEPTAGLDPQARRDTWALLRARAAAGTTVVVTTHLTAEAEEHADRVAVIARGRLRAEGTPAELVGGTGDRTLVRLVAADGGADVGAPLALADALTTALGVAVVARDDGLLEVAAVPDAVLLARLASALDARGAILAELRLGARTLEEAYLRLVTPVTPPQVAA